MSFFERQDAARTSSIRLVALFIAAVVGIVVVVDVVVLVLVHSSPAGNIASFVSIATVFTLLIIGGGSVYKTLSLRAGGSALALSVGAAAVDPTSTDPALRRFVNIVEEMSLASGVPVPRLFVLQDEAGINAFAAGYTPADAAITVTGGALHQLSRAELQGVIGHEFSHILNGDMRLNIRLIGLLNGILLLGLVGLRVLGTGGGRGRDKNAGPILLIALAMFILGFVGQFFANMIKAGVSRQREWLADASSVQFTRDPQGLEGALKKIAGLPTGSKLANMRNAKEVSHMLFGEGSAKFSSLFATHPPLMARISALDPTFRPDEVRELARGWANRPPDGLAEDAALGLAPTRPVAGRPASGAPALPAVGLAAALASGATRFPVQPAEVSGRVGTASPSDLDRGARLSAQVPPRFRQLANQGSTAVPLTLAMLLNAEPDVREKQLSIILATLGRETAQATTDLMDDVATLPPLLRLPVVSIAVPLITARPKDQLASLINALEQLSRADGTISVFEYCLTRMVSGYIRDSNDPPGRSKPGKVAVSRVQQAALGVLAVIAAEGNTEPAVAERAFTHAVQYLLPGTAVPYQPPAQSWDALDAAWPALDSLDPKHKGRFVEAITVAIRDDGVLGVDEAELLRTSCALLHCPLPSLIA